MINNLTIYLSSICNLNCSYCHYHLANYKKEIKKDKLLKSIYYFLKKFPNSQITFLGGEPLIHFNLLKKSILFIKKISPHTEITIFTNGTLLNSKIINFLLKEKVKIILSLDGQKESNDKNRKFLKSKKSVYEEIIKIIKGYENKIYISLVLSPNNINDFYENIKFLANKNFKGIGWNIEISSNWNNKNLSIFLKELNKVIIFYKKLLKEKKAYEIINRYEILSFVKNNYFPKCTSLSLFPDGNFYICDKLLGSKNIKEFNLGNYNKLNLNKREEIFKELEEEKISSQGLMCPVGVYLYYKFVKYLKDKKLEKEFKKKISLIKKIENKEIKFFKGIIKDKDFIKIHKI